MAHEVPISGQIDPKSFPFLLMDLHRKSATGSLKLDGPTYQKALYFRPHLLAPRTTPGTSSARS
jgi:hypothetical protein